MQSIPLLFALCNLCPLVLADEASFFSGYGFVAALAAVAAVLVAALAVLASHVRYGLLGGMRRCDNWTWFIVQTTVSGNV